MFKRRLTRQGRESDKTYLFRNRQPTNFTIILNEIITKIQRIDNLSTDLFRSTETNESVYFTSEMKNKLVELGILLINNTTSRKPNLLIFNSRAENIYNTVFSAVKIIGQRLDNSLYKGLSRVIAIDEGLQKIYQDISSSINGRENNIQKYVAVYKEDLSAIQFLVDNIATIDSTYYSLLDHLKTLEKLIEPVFSN